MIKTSVAQEFIIQGPTRVNPGDIVEYVAVGPYLPYGTPTMWSIWGGTILWESMNTCMVQWDYPPQMGWVAFFEDYYYTITALDVQIGNITLSPVFQMIDYQGSAQPICVDIEKPGATYSWEISEDGNAWVPIPNASGPCYTPDPITDMIMIDFRCIVTIGSVVETTEVAHIEIMHVDPGTITLAEQPNYNSPAIITSTPATHGPCLPEDYQYTWEMAVEGGPWVPIGNTQEFPLVSAPVKANSLIRRKIVCGYDIKYSNTISLTPIYVPEPTENRNYTRTFTVSKRGVQSMYEAEQLEVGKKFQETVYFDGLGRPVQNVQKGISLSADNNWLDMVSFTQYDNLGISTLQYLPYPSAADPGKYKTSTTEQLSFYANNYNETAPWGRIDRESSPLNRATKSIEAGSYRLNNDIGDAVDYDFNKTNTIDEKVHIWRIGYTVGGLPVTSASDVYAEGKLVKTTFTDDKGEKVIEYKDFDGNLVLRKIQLDDPGSGLSNEHDGWLCTYQVFDDFNRLRYVITPKAVAYLDANNWALPQSIADELCFYYEYDERGRVIHKKTPGAARLSLVYDHQGRVVFTQDGNQAAGATKEWIVNFYDELDRVVSTGIFRSEKSRAQLQTELDMAANTYTYNIQYDNPVVGEPLIVSSRSAGNAPALYQSPVSVEFLPGFSSLDNDAFVAEIYPVPVPSSQDVVITVDATLPVDINDPGTYTALSYHYYDDYGYAGVKSFYTSFDNALAYSPTAEDIEEIAVTNRTAGMVTGSKVRVLGTSTFLLSTIYYDENGRAIQVLADNYKSGTDIITNQYHFNGRLMSSHVKHGAAGSAFDNFSVLTKNTYNKIGQLITLEKKFGNAAFKKIGEYRYDEFGRLKTKKIGQKPASSDPLEVLSYSYDVIGLLTGINKDYALSTNNSDQWNNYFGLYLGYENYDNRFNKARFDGKLTGLIWKTQGDNTPRKYDFDYDNAGRFTGADFKQRSTPADNTWSNATMDFSESNILYDENGNLKQLYRKGIMPGNNSPLLVDKLTYTYKQVAGGEWSNQLQKIFDNNPDIGATANGSLGDFRDEVYNSNTDDYTYDENGNLVKDHNKKIRDGGNAGIVYNYLDKPEKIVLENKSVVEFIYDATGVKLAKKVTPVSGSSRTTYYAGDFVYEDNELQYILHEEGRLRIMTPASSTSTLGASALITNGNVELIGEEWGVYDYFIKDHLGSVRMVLTEETHQEIYKASMENSAATEEEPLFGKVDDNGNPLHPGNELYDSRLAKPATWSSNSTAYVSKLFTMGTGSTTSIGPNMLIKVMGGDYLHATSKYYYDVPTGSVGNQNILAAIVNSILGGFSGGGVNQAIKDGAGSIGTFLQDPVVSPLLPFMNDRPAPADDRPRAYLNYIFFDENFNYVAEGSGAVLVNGQVNDGSVTQSNIRVPRNGYAYVYLSNESNWPVYFDDFTVSHERGAIIEETHYYPYGLKIAGISSKAFNKMDKKYGFQGDYSEEESESGYNEFALRMYDPQTGRWNGVDPYDEFASPYVGMDPVNNTDPDGGQLSAGYIGAIIGTVAGFAAPYIYEQVSGDKVSNKGLWGLAGALIGAGLGYGVGESVAGEGGSVLLNMRAFYKGLFGGYGTVYNSRSFTPLHIGAQSSEAPDIWGDFSRIFSNLFNKDMSAAANVLTEVTPYIYDLVINASATRINGVDYNNGKPVIPEPGYKLTKLPTPEVGLKKFGILSTNFDYTDRQSRDFDYLSEDIQAPDKHFIDQILRNLKASNITPVSITIELHSTKTESEAREASYHHLNLRKSIYFYDYLQNRNRAAEAYLRSKVGRKVSVKSTLKFGLRSESIRLLGVGAKKIE